MKPSVVFMGTPDFAVPCLARLLDEGYPVKGVFSQPDRPKGRGHKLAAPPVKELALEKGIPVFQPVKMRDGTVLAQLKELQPDIIIVVAYGRLLPPDILAVPPLGCINVHASLLPRLRGAAPIQWSIINGDKVTGVTTMYMAEGLDTGDMILKEETPIGEDETAGELFERLSVLGGDLLSRTLALLGSGDVPRTKQEEALATHAPPIEKAMGAIDFSRPARELCNLIRGLEPSPCAFAVYKDMTIKVHMARPVEGSGVPGEILDGKKMIVACGEGAIELRQLQPQGKRTMDAAAFANGYHVAVGEKFTVD